jgi:hypothetical protein
MFAKHMLVCWFVDQNVKLAKLPNQSAKPANTSTHHNPPNQAAKPIKPHIETKLAKPNLPN